MVFDAGTIFIYLTGIFILYLFCWFFIKPIKWLIHLSFSCVLGVVGIFIFNLIMQIFNLHIAINPLTALITGVLGLPGMIMSLIFNLFL